jgi:protein-tyrosine-phosphatase
MAGLPSAILFACTMNSIRSPMAEAIMKHLHGHKVFVDSTGVRAGEQDPFVVAVMDEIGIDLNHHHAKTFGDLEDTYFDLVVTLSPEAHHTALEMTRTMACDVEFWPIFDPTAIEGSREVRLEAYRSVRDVLMKRITARFPQGPVPKV